MKNQISTSINQRKPEKLTNLKSLAEVQGKRLDNYTEGLDKFFLEPYTEEIEPVISSYNKTSSDKTMALRLARNSTRRIQTRRSHQDMVEGIAVMAAKKLRLNVGLTRIMARNHDIGHTFYGHGGEWWLSNVKEEYELGEYTHNSLGPKELIYRHGIYDEIMEKIKTYNPEMTDSECTRVRRSLWIIFDGINSHNGELSESEFRPNKGKTKENFEDELMRCHTEKGFDRKIMPATIEGCLMRMCDKIAYTPFDMVDGLYEGMIDKLDGDYVRILKGLGITDEEIESANVRHEYEGIARKLQVIFTKSLIENSSRTVIAMDPEISRLMHELRNLNNREIIDLEVLQEDQDIIPPAIKTLMNHYADLIQNNVNLDDLRLASTNYGLQKRLMDRYKGTPDEGFVRYILSTNPDIYDFNEEMIETVSRNLEAQGKAPKLDHERKMRLEFGAEYLSTLSDFEFLDLAIAQGVITEMQRKSLTRTYREIGREGLIKEQYRPKEWKEIAAAQKKAQEEMHKKEGHGTQGEDEEGR